MTRTEIMVRLIAAAGTISPAVLGANAEGRESWIKTMGRWADAILADEAKHLAPVFVAPSDPEPEWLREYEPPRRELPRDPPPF